MLMLLSIYLPQNLSPNGTGDPGRIAAQVVSGIGFLGAGAIMRLGNNVRGLTTAASIWFVAAVGLLIGSGMFLVAGIAIALGLITLMLLHTLERKVFPSGQFKLLEITYKDNKASTKEAIDIVKNSGIQIQSTNINHGAKDKGIKVRLLVRIPDTTDIAYLTRTIKSSGPVSKVQVTEKY